MELDELIERETASASETMQKSRKDLAPELLIGLDVTLDLAKQNGAGQTLRALRGESAKVALAADAVRYLQAIAVKQIVHQPRGAGRESPISVLEKVWVKRHGKDAVQLSQQRLADESRWAFDSCLRLAILDPFDMERLTDSLMKYSLSGNVKFGPGELNSIDDYRFITKPPK